MKLIQVESFVALCEIAFDRSNALRCNCMWNFPRFISGTEGMSTAHFIETSGHAKND